MATLEFCSLILSLTFSWLEKKEGEVKVSCCYGVLSKKLQASFELQIIPLSSVHSRQCPLLVGLLF